MTPQSIFFTKGVGRNKTKLGSFEAALRDAGIERFNLVSVSSILPPGCQIIPRDEGLKKLSSGQIVYCVIARIETDEPNRLISAAIGLAVPTDKTSMYGYLSEHHAYGQTDEKSSEFAEDLAATMLATTLNVDFNPDSAWDEREQVYKASGKIFRTSSICQSALGDKNGDWTTVVSAAVFAP
ncbi:MAG: arginine decarboxylase, pyruvoyl-dependent [Candidatus Wildermuthbacteria bacterium RIFCSPHIGHO2_02_FULL_47_12]|uniref:Pyruvoyl-dependent arginine decarboxylase AaxB n=2 Tax=Parcubacteria group TaxID=1794811 RepID=A0A1G2R5C3_9BACT|nr:MAG: arginine decarboxylase, pyruvoyl-dependent [Candidatus Buchananbacteria bacterium RIFCSPLOWO2_01_FULL_46_12]OHA67589.1 MAG: arginine decarboxylase, pyruvoyl-dependent [Candidatus Wildermuthbacteria bacterium RIFCSPHIGHO2_02_FULL_47_12]